MARKRTYEDTRPKSDVYTGLLVISLLAMIGSCLMLYLDMSQYPTTKPPALPPLPTAAPKAAASIQLPPPPVLEDRPIAATSVASDIKPVAGTETPNVPAPVIPAVVEVPVPAPVLPPASALPPVPAPGTSETSPAPAPVAETPPAPMPVIVAPPVVEQPKTETPPAPPAPTPVPAPQPPVAEAPATPPAPAPKQGGEPPPLPKSIRNLPK